MRTKLERLEVADFLGLRHADMDLTAPCHLVVGANGAGKSCIVDALTMVFTGRVPARGYHKKNQSPQMVNRDYGSPEYRIFCKTNSGLYEATAKGAGNPPYGDDFALMLDPQVVLGMAPAARQAAFAALQRGDTGEAIVEYLKQEEPGFGEDIQNRCKKSLDAAQKWAVEQRQIAGRTVKKLQANAPKPAPVVVTVADQNYNLADERCAPEKIVAKQQEAMNTLARLEAIDKSGVEVESIKQVNDAHRAQITSLPAPEGLKDAAKKAAAAATKAGTAHSNARAKAAGIEKELEITYANLEQIDGLKAKCPTCLQGLTEAHVATCREAYKADIKLLHADLRAATEKANEAKSKAAAANKASRMAAESVEENKRAFEHIGDQIAQNEAYMAEVRDNQHAEAIAKLKIRVDHLSQLREAVANYREWLVGDKNRQLMLAEAEGTIDEMNALDDLLKPDGELRKIANADVAGAQIDQPLAKAWGMQSLMLQADGTIELYGAPVECASKSERWRAGVLLAELLARHAGYGILLLDGIDILDVPGRRALLERMPAWMANFGTIMLMMTGNPRTMNWPAEAWLQGWVVENGIVAQVADSPVAGKAVQG